MLRVEDFPENYNRVLRDGRELLENYNGLLRAEAHSLEHCSGVFRDERDFSRITMGAKG